MNNGIGIKQKNEFFMYQRESKPRDAGQTIVLDKRFGIEAAKDLMDIAASHIDAIKLGWGTWLVSNPVTVQKKIALYRENNILVMPGGTSLEYLFIHYKQSMDSITARLKAYGFNAIEISDGSTVIEDADRVQLIKHFTHNGFRVYTEVGKKNKEEDSKLSMDTRIAQIKSDLESGAHKVILEARESGMGIGMYDDKGKVIDSFLNQILSRFSHENLVFEAPQLAQQAYLIKKIGSNVNLANIAPEEVISVETLRAGLRGNTFNIKGNVLQ